jgi:hypothetical protein
MVVDAIFRFQIFPRSRILRDHVKPMTTDLDVCALFQHIFFKKAPITLQACQELSRD